MASNDAADAAVPPLDLSHHLSRTAKARTASALKSMYKYMLIPGIGQAAGGLPYHRYFPFDSFQAQVAAPDRWKTTPNDHIDSSAQAKDGAEHNKESGGIDIPKASKEPNPLKKIDIQTALQYGTAQGYPPLYGFLRHWTRSYLHPNTPYKDGPEIIMTCGNTDGFSKVLYALTDEWHEEKDWPRDRQGVLVEHFAYSTALQAMLPRGLNIVPVSSDDEGMQADGPGALREVLENWDYKKGRRPHLLYTVTMGQNPTSALPSLARRRELYALASEYDIIIVEDDPYWCLQYPSALKRASKTTGGEQRPATWKSSGYDFIDSLVPSSLNIDTEGRVIRLETFSKIIAPGCRVGWLTAQPALVERILRLTETTTSQPSGFVSAFVAELILGAAQQPKGSKGSQTHDLGWQIDGWVRWIAGIRGNYERRMNTMASILDKGREQVKTGRRYSLSEVLSEATLDDGGTASDEWAVVEKKRLYSFDWPLGGMFIWLKVHFENHPLWDRVDGARLSRALWIFWTTKPYLVLVGPGAFFSPSDEIRDKEGWQYFRITFAAAEEEDLADVSQRIVDGVNAFWRLKSKGAIDDLLKDDDEPAPETLLGMESVAQLAGTCL